MKKIMILGIGSAQADAIRYCKAHGLEVHGCSNSADYEGRQLLDVFVQLDIRDKAGIAAYVENNRIDWVYSVGSDLAMPTVMAVSEQLQLPHFVSAAIAEICQNKQRLRQFLGPDFPGNLPFCAAAELAATAGFNAFPAMLKPVDSQGQRGCYRVNNRQELAACFPDALVQSFCGQIILEQYVDGPEVSVNAFVHNGSVIFSLISDRLVFTEYPGGIIREHHLPSRTVSEPAAARIRSLAEAVIGRLGIQNGPVYFQIKLDGDTPWLIEVTPRLDGCHMWRLIHHYCGIDLLDAAFRLLMAGPDAPFTLPAATAARPGRLVFICDKPGIRFDREAHPLDFSANYYHIEWYYQTGERVDRRNGYMEKCGYVICDPAEV